eukprot:358331_1
MYVIKTMVQHGMVVAIMVNVLNPSQIGKHVVKLVPSYRVLCLMKKKFVIRTASGPCNTSEYPQGSGMPDTDLMIYFTGAKDNTYECGGVMGFAGPCHSNSRNRPIAGYVNLCRSTIDSAKVLTWE